MGEKERAGVLRGRTGLCLAVFHLVQGTGDLSTLCRSRVLLMAYQDSVCGDSSAHLPTLKAVEALYSLDSYEATKHTHRCFVSSASISPG